MKITSKCKHCKKVVEPILVPNGQVTMVVCPECEGVITIIKSNEPINK